MNRDLRAVDETTLGPDDHYLVVDGPHRRRAVYAWDGAHHHQRVLPGPDCLVSLHGPRARHFAVEYGDYTVEGSGQEGFAVVRRPDFHPTLSDVIDVVDGRVNMAMWISCPRCGGAASLVDDTYGVVHGRDLAYAVALVSFGYSLRGKEQRGHERGPLPHRCLCAEEARA